MLKIEPFLQNKISLKTVKPITPSFTGTAQACVRPVLEKDTFEASEKDLLSLSDKEILKGVKASMKQIHYLGDGGEGIVFRLLDANYAVKIPFDLQSESEIGRNFKRISKLDNEDKVNHVVMKFKNGVKIMNLIDGYSLEHENKTKYKNNIVTYFPVSSFNKLFKQVAQARKYNMVLDYSGSNVMINPKDKSITALDFAQKDISYLDTYKPLCTIYESVAMNTDDPMLCTGLILLGALDEFKPGVKPCLPPDRFCFNSFVKYIEKTMPDSDLIDLNELNRYLNELKELKKLELKGNNVSEELSQKLETAQRFINESFTTSS